MQSVLVVPVRGDEGKVVGVIECINADQALGFTSNDDSNIKALAGCLSTMLRKTDLDREVNMRRKQTEALHHISAIISAELGVKRVIDRIVQACRLVVSASCIRVWVLDDVTRELVLSAQVAPGNERGAGGGEVRWTWNEDNPERIKFTEGILGNVALTGGTANVADVTKDWRYESERKRDKRNGPPVKAMLATAVKDYLAGRTIAVLECINKPSRDSIQSFTTDDETLLQSIASTAASVLRQAQLYEEAVRIRKQTEALKNIIELMSADIGTGMLVTRIIDASYKVCSYHTIPYCNSIILTKGMINIVGGCRANHFIYS
jgi:GAF domain-containing protein